MNTIDLWKSNFGKEYTERNGRWTLPAREHLFKQLLPIGCESVLEVGANTGLNLLAIAQRSACAMSATEPNDVARAELVKLNLCKSVTADTADALSFPDGFADLVLTSGVLIHVPPDKLAASLDEIHRVARRWIICGEYFAPQEEMIPYRGHDNALWRRDYGSLFLDTFSDLKCTAHMFAWKRETGLDNLTFWVFEKTNG
jgi:pseudaminic acid biosynthesis-associated methylase